MRRLIPTLARLLVLTVTILTASAATDPELLKEFTALYKKWDTALVQGDAKAEGELLADSFIGTDHTGSTFTKQDSAKATESGKEKIWNSVSEALELHPNGNIVIVTGKWIAAGTSEGKPWGGTHQFTDTWTRQDGRWLCLASQVTKIESKIPGSPGAKPGPEQQRLAKIAGKWEMEGTVFDGPTQTPGKTKRVEEDRMICGGWFLEMRGHGVGPEGPNSTVEILAWDSEKGRYQDSWFASGGAFDKAWKNENATATIEGNTWNWEWAEQKDGRKYQIKSKVAYAEDYQSFEMESFFSEDGLSWKRRDQSKGRRIGDATHEPTGATIEIERATAKWADGWNRGDGAAVAALYCKEGQLLAPAHPIMTGRAAIQRYIEQDVKENPNTTTAIQSLEVQEFGDTAWQISSYYNKQDGKKISSGKGITLWKLEDGAWKIARDTWNEDAK